MLFRSYSEAAKWVRKAADKGLKRAQISLSMAYQSGQGVDQDYVMAYMWMDLGSSDGNEEALAVLKELADFMTPEQVQRAQDLVAQWRAEREK